MGRGGIEPPTLGLRVALLQGICRRYRLLIPVRAGWFASQLPSSEHGRGHALAADVFCDAGRAVTVLRLVVLSALSETDAAAGEMLVG
jgi:hypothetical protein